MEDEKMFVTFAQHYPPAFNEHYVLKSIDYAIDCAVKKQKEKDPEYIKYAAKAYKMLEMYFNEKGVHPSSY
jgi:hypothetical protein